MIPMSSGLCEAAEEHADAGDHDPRLGAGDAGLEVFGEAAVATEPGKGSLDHPSFWLGFECPKALGSGDDLDSPFAKIGDRVEQLVPAVDTVSEDVPQFSKRDAEAFQQRHVSMIVLDIG